jgi:ABC-type phosphate transport system substrate-binding protein
MSAFKQKAGKLGVRAGFLAAASAAVLAIGGASAGSALAAECGSGTPANIQGQGSSLQRIAQEVLTGRVVPTVLGTALPHTALTPASGYAAACPSGTTVSYTSTSSGKGLTAFRFNGAGSIENGGTEPEKGFAYVGSDDGPNATQIENAEKATTGGVLTGAKPLIIPVAQTAIAVPIHLPASCAFTTEKGLTYTDLNAIFNGKMKSWSEVSNLTGAGCTGTITRVVRAEGSGTTFQFKNYLQALQTGHSGVGPECGVSNWSELEEIGAEEKPNITWPECEISAGNPRIAVVRKAGGGEVAAYIAANAGTIGYAALPDAKSKSAAVARLQDKGGATPAYATPEAETGEKANCGTRVYTVPTPGRAAGPGGVPPAESGLAVNWSQVFGASAEVGGELYPLCTLTYDISWNSYEKAGYSNSANVAADVKKYINYVLSTEGQTLVNSHYYQKLPSPTSQVENVLGAAQLAAGNIG